MKRYNLEEVHKSEFEKRTGLRDKTMSAREFGILYGTILCGMAGVAGLLWYMNYKAISHDLQKPRVSIEGIVRGESTAKNVNHWANYAFTIETKDGELKSFRVFDADNALDSRINSGYQLGVGGIYEDEQDRSYFEIWRSQIKYIRF